MYRPKVRGDWLSHFALGAFQRLRSWVSALRSAVKEVEEKHADLVFSTQVHLAFGCAVVTPSVPLALTMRPLAKLLKRLFGIVFLGPIALRGRLHAEGDLIGLDV